MGGDGEGHVTQGQTSGVTGVQQRCCDLLECQSGGKAPKIASAHQHTTNRPSGLWMHPQRPSLLALLAVITLENEMLLCFSFCWTGSPPKLCVDTEWSWKSIPTTTDIPPDRSGIHHSGNYRSWVYPSQTCQAVHRLLTHKL